MTNHLGNVLATISDKRYGVSTNDSTVNYFIPEMVSANDYYPFGSLQPGRAYTESGMPGYRYGFNGKEKDDEVKGAGDQIDYGMRVYDPRVGRFMSLDPLQKNYPWWSPYHFAGNSPIANVDLDGRETYNYILTINERTGKAVLLLQSVEHGSLFDALTVQKVNYYGRIYTIDAEWNRKPYHGFTTVNQLVGKTEAQLDEYFASKKTDDELSDETTKRDDESFKQAGEVVFAASALDEIQTKPGGTPEETSNKQAASANDGNKEVENNNTPNGNSEEATTAGAAKTTPLDWSRVNYKGETAEQHVELHGQDNTRKPLHGIFNGDPVKVTNNAWNSKGNIQPIKQENGNDMYIIPVSNAGYEGGSKGSKQTLNYVTIITSGGTNKVVTAYPSK